MHPCLKLRKATFRFSVNGTTLPYTFVDGIIFSEAETIDAETVECPDNGYDFGKKNPVISQTVNIPSSSHSASKEENRGYAVVLIKAPSH